MIREIGEPQPMPAWLALLLLLLLGTALVVCAAIGSGLRCDRLADTPPCAVEAGQAWT